MSNLPSLLPAFPPPRNGKPDLLIVAGEHSGDQHAARLLRELTALHPGLKTAAVGGPLLEGAGAQLLFDLTRHSVVGFFEVFRHYGFFRDLFRETVSWIERYAPRNICLVDYPGFNLRLARRLFRRGISRKGGGEIGLYYYIGPQIWAWKAQRRFAMAEMLDAMGVIFPFEADCYRDTALPVRFVGHPFLAEGCVLPLEYNENASLLLLPGSRRVAVSRIFPIMADAFSRVLERKPEEKATIIYPDSEVLDVLKGILREWPQLEGKYNLVPAGATCAGKAALTSSGTISLACALAGIPGAIVYRAHPLTYFFGKMLVRVPWLGIANLLLDQPIYPEYLQGNATPKNLALALQNALESEKRTREARDLSARLRDLLSCPKDYSAGAWLHEMIE